MEAASGLYFLVLVAIVLSPSAGRWTLPELSDLPPLFVGAVLANLCFFAGPIAETCLAWLGVRAPIITACRFALGMLVSVPLVFIFGLAYALSVS